MLKDNRRGTAWKGEKREKRERGNLGARMGPAAK